MMTSPESLHNRPHLTIDTSPQPATAATADHYLDGSNNDPKTPPGLRGHSDIRAPGFAKTPLNADTTTKVATFANEEESTNNNNNVNVNSIASPTAATATNNNAQAPSEEPRSPLADFITQTDKYGNASTPRTAEAITSARKLHPEGPKPLLHVDSETGVVMEGNDAIGSSSSHTSSSQALLKKDEHVDGGGGQQVGGGGGGGAEDTCDTLLDSFRMMCCCLLPEDTNNNTNGENTTTGGGGTTGNNKKDDHSTSSTSSKSSNPNNNHTSSTSNDYPIGYSTRGHDAPLLLEEDSALRNNPKNIKLLPELHYTDVGKKCLVLDLDETLVHSSFRAVPGADFVIPVQIEDVVHFVYVAKRPGVDEFLIEMAKHYEIVVYTASLNKYADVLLDLLDPHRVIRTRLFRESCVFYEGNYVKDLCLLNRDLSQCIIIDNSPASYMFHPENAIDCSSFIDDVNDRELDQIGKCLIGMKDVPDVRGTVNLWRHWPNVDLTKNHRRIR